MLNSIIQACGSIFAAFIQRPSSGKSQAQKDWDFINLRHDMDNLESRLNKIIDFTIAHTNLPEPERKELLSIQKDLILVSRRISNLSSTIDHSAYKSARKWLLTKGKRKYNYNNGQNLIIEVLQSDKIKECRLNDEQLKDVKALLLDCLFWVDKTLERNGDRIEYKVPMLSISNEISLLAIDLVQDNLRKISQRSTIKLVLSKYSYLGKDECQYINYFLEKIRSYFLL